MRRSRYLPVFAFLTACAPDSNPAPPPPLVASAAMPELERIPIVHRLDTLFWHIGYQIAVSANGLVLVAGNLTEYKGGDVRGKLAQIIDAAADTLIEIIPEGEGPGELSGIGAPFSADDRFIFLDSQRGVVLTFSDKGRLLDQHRTESSYQWPVAITSDSIDYMLQQRILSPNSPILWRTPFVGEKTRSLTFPGDTFASRLLEDSAQPDRPTSRTPYASRPGGFALADPLHYQIAVYDDNGVLRYRVHREIEQRRRTAMEVAAFRKSNASAIRMVSGRGGEAALLATLQANSDTADRTIMPYFLWRGMHFDGRDRLWVVGQVGDDSTFADVFADSVFLGRRMFGCAKAGRRIAINGEYLALVCEVRTNETAPFELQLYHMKEPN